MVGSPYNEALKSLFRKILGAVADVERRQLRGFDTHGDYATPEQQKATKPKGLMAYLSLREKPKSRS